MPNLIELARRLHEERLFVRSEQDTIWKLNDKVRENAEKLSHSFWITRQHYLNLNQLIGKRLQSNPAACSQRANQLDYIQFVDAYKELGYQESMYSQFLEAFSNNPTLAAACLAYGDKLGLEETAEVARIIVLGCYGNNIITDNHKSLLELMETLMLLQIASEDQPRRLLQKGNCAFCTVFNLFTESLMAGKLFLMAALHQPIMEVLMDDELYLETDSHKMLSRLSEYEIKRRFGDRNGPSFQENVAAHIRQTEKALAEICNQFVSSLVAAMSSFPQSLGWVIARAYHIVNDAGVVSAAEAKALSADFLLQSFVCPAIVDPERYGITGNIPVSDLTRANLMQIAQVLQVVAHWEDSASQQPQPVFDRVDKATMKSMIDRVIGSCNAEGIPPTSSASRRHNYVTSVVFLTPAQIAHLVTFLRKIQLSNVQGVDQSSLQEVLSHLPNNPPACILRATNLQLAAENVRAAEDDGVQKRSGGGSGGGGSMSSPSSTGDLVGLINSTSNTTRKLFSKSTARAKMKSPLKRDDVQMNDSGLDESASGDNPLLSSPEGGNEQPEVVLVISVNSTGSDNDIPGTLTETEVMELRHSGGGVGRSSEEGEEEQNASNDHALDIENGMDKRSQFSLYFGGSNLSEIGEELPTEDGISHRTSASSSIDLDPPESVRGSSQGGNQDEDEEEEEGGDDQESVTRVSQDEALKLLRRKLPTSRESIEDKMRKFELRGSEQAKQKASDARSDTWSVDVYASDSEQPANELLPTANHHDQAPPGGERLREIAEDPAEHLRNQAVGSFLGLSRDEDSRSDIWSVEVLASDSEPPDIQSDVRLQELESESGPAVAGCAEDAVEDNRSRASTPGLSAASGFSGVSGLSLTSESTSQMKGEYLAFAANSERSFDKQGPSSMSPDADELRAGADTGSLGSRGGASSNSSGADQQPAAAAHHHAPLLSQSPVAGGGGKEPAVAGKSRVGGEKTVAWNIPDSSPPQHETPPLILMQVEESRDQNTIKRSPYKSSSSQQQQQQRPKDVTIAWGDDVIATSSSLDDVTSAFHPVRHAGDDVAGVDLKDFDPLVATSTPTTPRRHDNDNNAVVVADDGSRQQPSSSSSAPSASTGGGGGRSTEAASDAARDDNRQKIPSSSSGTSSNAHMNGLPYKDIVRSTMMKQGSSHEFGAEGGNPRGKGLERKKSWWKTSRFTKKVRPTASQRFEADSNPRPPTAPNFDATGAGDESMSSHSSKSDLQSMRQPGEDIMEKYMRKMTTQGNDGGKTEPSGAPSDGDLINVGYSDRAGNDATTTEAARRHDNRDGETPPAASSTTGNNPDNMTSLLAEWDGPMTSSRSPPARQRGDVTMTQQQRKSTQQLHADAKRKLRIVMSTAESLPDDAGERSMMRGVTSLMTSSSSSSSHGEEKSGSDADAKLREQLQQFIRTQLAEALGLQDHSRVAQLNEVKRCLDQLHDRACRDIVQELWREYNQRSSYIAYLVRSRQHLLTSASYFHHVTQSTNRDRAICRRYLTRECVRIFLKRREQEVDVFVRRFVTSSMFDEKVRVITSFLRRLFGQMVEDRIWEGANEEQLSEAEECIEKILFTFVYKKAMFPNGDGDLLRDQLFREHISRLSAVITPAHPALQISAKYLLECPWHSAQAEARSLAAYRSPRGKLEAALRCCKAVMHLLKLADEQEVPGADDFTPVLVFVLIKANPSHLLSTVAYVNAYIGEGLAGEDSYWWMQFTAATEFIKTIDERK